MLPDRDRDLFAELFMGRFADKHNNPRMAKADALYQLGKEAQGGSIVELGTYHGCGAVALALGAKGGSGCLVYTVDDYPQRRTGWAGEPYVADDEAVFWRNTKAAKVNVLLMKCSATEAAKRWSGPISLLFWDTGTQTMLDDFRAWSPFMVPGALFVIHDTGDHKFHSPGVIREALGKGWELGPVFRRGYITTIRKPPHER